MLRPICYALATAGCVGLLLAAVDAQDLTPAPGADSAPAAGQFEDLTRGPIHEAFAEQVNLDPVPGQIISKEPPAPIDELPPEVKPEGDVHFVPGYWALDEASDDFVWVSGVWRKFPPDRRFVPGYWNQVEGGWQWVPGTWAAADTGELAYLPQPPDSLEAGPTSVAPSADQFWVPGCWQYRNANYAWQPGYWSPGYSDWVWVPNRYCWTPRGYVYLSGYWDYPFIARGLLFAPRVFYGGVRAGVRLSARVALAPARLLNHLFIRPLHHHYYFGDYYGARFATAGYYPWYAYQSRYRHGFDPLFHHDSWRYARQGVNYGHYLSGWHDYYDKNPSRRPSHTFAGQAAFESRQAGDRFAQRSLLAGNVSNVSALGIRDRMQTLGASDRQRFAESSGSLRTLAMSRRSFEGGANRGPGAADDRIVGNGAGPAGRGAGANVGEQGNARGRADLGGRANIGGSRGPQDAVAGRGSGSANALQTFRLPPDSTARVGGRASLENRGPRTEGDASASLRTRGSGDTANRVRSNTSSPGQPLSTPGVGGDILGRAGDFRGSTLGRQGAAAGAPGGTTGGQRSPLGSSDRGSANSAGQPGANLNPAIVEGLRRRSLAPGSSSGTGSTPRSNFFEGLRSQTQSPATTRTPSPGASGSAPRSGGTVLRRDNPGAAPSSGQSSRSIAPRGSSAPGSQSIVPRGGSTPGSRSIIPRTSSPPSTRTIAPRSTSAPSSRSIIPRSSSAPSSRSIVPRSSSAPSNRSIVPRSSSAPSSRSIVPRSSSAPSSRSIVPRSGSSSRGSISPAPSTSRTSGSRSFGSGGSRSFGSGSPSGGSRSGGSRSFGGSRSSGGGFGRRK